MNAAVIGADAAAFVCLPPLVPCVSTPSVNLRQPHPSCRFQLESEKEARCSVWSLPRFCKTCLLTSESTVDSHSSRAAGTNSQTQDFVSMNSKGGEERSSIISHQTHQDLLNIWDSRVDQCTMFASSRTQNFPKLCRLDAVSSSFFQRVDLCLNCFFSRSLWYPRASCPDCGSQDGSHAGSFSLCRRLNAKCYKSSFPASPIVCWWIPRCFGDLFSRGPWAEMHHSFSIGCIFVIKIQVQYYWKMKHSTQLKLSFPIYHLPTDLIRKTSGICSLRLHWPEAFREFLSSKAVS